MTEVNIHDKKLLFAKYFVETENAIEAARLTFPFNNDLQLEAFNCWLDDPIVKDYVTSKKQIRTDALPTKDEFAYQIYNDALTTNDPFAREKLYKLFAGTMGYLQKPSDVTINNNVATETTTNKVMIVYDTLSPDDWENKAIAQQESLENDNFKAT